MNTRLVAAAITSGILPISGGGFYSDTVEDKGDGNIRRQVTWCLNGKATAHFKPDFKEETIDFNEFRDRFDSLEWCEANPNHPISYMRGYVEHHMRFVDKIKTQRPMMLIRKGKRTAVVPSGNDPESVAKRDEILAKF